MRTVTFTGPDWDKIPNGSDLIFPEGGPPHWRRAGTNEQGEQLYEITMEVLIPMRRGVIKPRVTADEVEQAHRDFGKDAPVVDGSWFRATNFPFGP